jgi:hypothetical protein
MFLDDMKKRIPESLPYVPKYSNIMRYVLNGLPDRYWYEETHKDVVALFPNEEPRVLFDLLAATSIRSSIEANAKKFFLALHQYHHGVPEEMTIRLGSARKKIFSRFKGFMGTMILHLNDIHNGTHLCENLDEETARKIKNFAKAMMGFIDAIPVDIHIMRAFDTDIKAMYKGKMMSRSPTSKLYDAIHEYFRIVAKAVDFETRQISAMTWAGIRGETSVSKTTRFAPLIQKALDQGLFRHDENTKTFYYK